jgi:hypothetical protein
MEDELNCHMGAYMTSGHVTVKIGSLEMMDITIYCPVQEGERSTKPAQGTTKKRPPPPLPFTPAPGVLLLLLLLLLAAGCLVRDAA